MEATKVHSILAFHLTRKSRTPICDLAFKFQKVLFGCFVCFDFEQVFELICRLHDESLSEIKVTKGNLNLLDF